MSPPSEPLAPPIAEPGLSLEGMKQFVLNHFEEFVNRKNTDIAFRSFSADFLDHDEPGGVAIGPEAAKRMMHAAFQRWPDLHVTVEHIIAEGDKVMVRNVWRGTEAKDGTRIEFHGFVLWRFAAGKFVERWATITEPKDILNLGAEPGEPEAGPLLRPSPTQAPGDMEQLLAGLRAIYAGFNPPASEEDLAQLEEITGPLPEDLLRLYRDHDGVSPDLRSDRQPWPARLMPIEEVLRTHDAFIPILDSNPTAGNLTFLWTDDNSNYCGLYTDGPLQGWLAILDHDEPVLLPAFRSTTSFLDRFLTQTGGEEDEAAEPAEDLLTLRPEVPATAPDPAHDEADGILAAEFFEFSEDQDDDEDSRFCTLCGVCLTPFDQTAGLLPLLETDDISTQEAVVTLFEFRNFQDGVDSLEELARSGNTDGDGAAMRCLLRLGTDAAHQALSRLKMTLSEPKLRTLLMWERQAESLPPPRWP